MPTKLKRRPAKAKATKTTAKTTAKTATNAPKGATKAAKKAPRPPKKAPAQDVAPKTAAVPAGPSPEALLRSLANVKQFFDRTLATFDESDAAFAPKPEMFTCAQQVAHTAQTFDWFLEGAFRPEGFQTDFPALEAKVREVTSLARAKTWLDEAYGRLVTALRERPAAEWGKTIPLDTLMGGAPRTAIIDGLADHTAHHRGSLAVYARLRGKTPAMPYM